MIELTKAYEDARGLLYLFNFRNSQFLLHTSVSGAPRGGHWHKQDTIHIVLHGSYQYVEVDTKDTANRTEKVISVGDVVLTKARMAHLLVALEDSLGLEIKRGEYEVVNYQPLREKVEEWLRHRSIKKGKTTSRTNQA